MRLIDIKHHHIQDNLKSVNPIELTTTVHKMISVLGFKMLRMRAQNMNFIKNWEHVVSDDSFSTNRMNEPFDRSKSKMITTEMAMQNIIMNVNKVLKPF